MQKERSEAIVINGSDDFEVILDGMKSVRDMARDIRVTKNSLEQRKKSNKVLKATDVADLPSSMQIEELAQGEYFPKVYDQERLVELTEMMQRLKTCISTMGTCSARLGMKIAPSRNRRVADLTKEEMDRFKIQSEELELYLSNIVETGVMFEEYAAYLAEAKWTTGDGYLEVVENAKGDISAIFQLNPKYMWVRRGMNGKPDGYIQMFRGEKIYFKDFGDTRIISAKTGKEDKATPLGERANSVLHYKQHNLLSRYYGVPLWTASIPAVLGSRYAEERNAAFFDNDAPLAVTTRVLTSYGWTTLEKITLEDRVIGSDGCSIAVTEVLPSKMLDTFEITLEDGRKCYPACTHVWTVKYNGDMCLVNTDYIDRVMDNDDHADISIPILDDYSNIQWIKVSRITSIGVKECKCIRVNSKDNLFVIDDNILTHNCPRLAVLVMGGALDDVTVETMKKFFKQGKGKENYGRVLVVQASARNANNPDVKPPVIKMEPLTVGKTDDQSFGQYLQDSREEVREAFRISSIFFGTSDDVNRAAAFTMREMTISQVFAPESNALSYFLNDTLVRRWAVSKGYLTLDKAGKVKDNSKLEVQIGFKLPETMSDKDKSEMFTSYAAAGGLSCNDIRDILNLPRIDKDWANIPQSLAVVMMQMQMIQGETFGNYDAVDATLDQNLTKAINLLNFIAKKQMDPFNILSFKNRKVGEVENT